MDRLSLNNGNKLIDDCLTRFEQFNLFNYAIRVAIIMIIKLLKICKRNLTQQRMALETNLDRFRCRKLEAAEVAVGREARR